MTQDRARRSLPAEDAGAAAPPAPFAGLDAETWEALTAAGELRELRRDAQLEAAAPGSRPRGVLVRGALRVQASGTDRRRRIANIVLPGETLPEGELEAAGPAAALILPAGGFARLAEDRPAIDRLERRSREARLARLRWLAWAVVSLNGHARVRAFLDRAAPTLPVTPLPRGSFLLTLPLPPGDVAELLGLTARAAEQALSELEGEGLLRRQAGERLEIFDPRGLEAQGGRAPADVEALRFA